MVAIFRLLRVFIVSLFKSRRRLEAEILSPHPTAEWLAQRIVAAFSWETAPTFLMRDNDGLPAAGSDDRDQRPTNIAPVILAEPVLDRCGSSRIDRMTRNDHPHDALDRRSAVSISCIVTVRRQHS